MLSNNLSAGGLFPSSHCRPRLNSGSSRSSSAFSSQNFTTQSDTEAEEEKKFEKRRQQRRQMATAMTPSRLMWPGGGRKEFVTPMMFAASCSTPKSSLEHLDETSIYFRPLSNHKLMGFGQNGDAGVGRESRKQRSMEQQQRKLINDLARQNRRHRTLESNKRGSKTSQIVRKHHNGDGRIFGADFGPSLHRRHHHHRSNPLMAFLEEDGEGRCSSPILLDFPGPIPTHDNEMEEHRNKEGGNFGIEKVFIPANSSDQFEPNYAIPRKNPIGLMQNCRQHCYTNLSPFLRIIQKPAKRTSMVISPHDENTGEPKSNSDSGMEERNTLEEEWEKQTQFVNISEGEEAKLYENLPPPPTIHQQMEAPKPPTRRPPANPPQQPYFGTMGNQPHQSMPSHHQFMVEDVPALYGRLATAAFIQARNVEGGGTMAPKMQMMSSIEKARRIRLAQRELAELVGIRLAKGVELSGTALDSDENFRRKSIEFGTQLAQKLRQTEAHSRKEFNWQIKKLQKILHELRRRTGEEDERRRRSGGEGGGTLHKLFKRVFNWK